MADLLDDTFKLTIDKAFFGKTMTLDQVREETEYELLYSQEMDVNERS